MSAIAIYVTCKDEAEAKSIATRLLEQKLIACANISEHKSVYSWKGKVAQEKEHNLLMKSRKELFPRILHEIKGIHSYELPCIVCWDIEGDHDYLAWVESETK